MDDTELFRAHCNTVYQVFANKLRARTDVEDLVQLTFERFFAADRSNVQRPVGYLLRIAHNLLREYWRKRHLVDPDASIDEQAVADLAPGASTLMGRGEDEQFVLDGLRTLPMRQQAVLELHYWSGRSYREIAEVLEIAEGTVGALLTSGRRNLKRFLEKHNVSKKAESSESSESPESLDERMTVALNSTRPETDDC